MAGYKEAVTVAMNGTVDEVVVNPNINAHYQDIELTFNGITTGTAIVEAKADGSDRFTRVIDGTVDLTIDNTISIKGFSLEALQINVSAATAYTLLIKQTNFKQS